MSQLIPVLKDSNNQCLIPSLWRKTLSEIVHAFVCKNYRLYPEINGVISLSEKDADRIKENLTEYGEELIELPNDTWNTSMCQWTNDYWDILVDLYTDNGASDLALSVRVKEVGNQYMFEVISVHVP